MNKTLTKEEAMQELTRLNLESIKSKCPNNPYATSYKKYEDKTANGLTKCVIRYIQLKGWQAERINSTGRYVAPKTYTDVVGFQRTIGKGYWIKGTSTAGTADISATIWGTSVKIEVKAGKDRQSERQKEYQKAIEQAGGIYIIVRSFADFLNWYNSFNK